MGLLGGGAWTEEADIWGYVFEGYILSSTLSCLSLPPVCHEVGSFAMPFTMLFPDEV
jgi:hypothetical protein